MSASGQDQKPRSGGLFRTMLQLVQRPPWLTTVAAVAGAIAFMVYMQRAMQELATPAHRGLHIMFSRDPDDERTLEAFYQLFRECWLKAAWIFSPAVVLAFLRQRRADLVLPVFLICIWVFVLWVAYDLQENWSRVHIDPLGLRPSLPAYLVKLGLTGFLMLSPPVLLWLYWHATILDRYLVRSFCVPLLLCLFGIAGIMITMDLLNNANDFVEAKYGIGKVMLFYLYQLPQIIVTIAEAVLLLASIYALSRLARYNELISMLGAGRSVLRIVTPLLIIGAWSSLVVLALNYQLAPESERSRSEVRLEAQDNSRESKSKALGRVEYNVAYRNREDRRTWLIHQLPFDLSDDNKMLDVVVIHDAPDGKFDTMWVARKAMWFAGLATWRFYDVTIFHRVDDRWVSKEFSDARYITEEWRETPGGILNDKLNPEYLGVQDLVAYLKTNDTLPDRSLARYRTTLQSRFATPFRCFLMVLIAAPLAMVSSRRGILGGVASALGIFVLVYFLSVTVQKLAEGGYVKPWAGAWSVTAVFALVGVWLLWMRAGNRELPSLNPFKRKRVVAL